METFTILIVCLGNICRSPMAEAILKSRLDKMHTKQPVFISSAGLAQDGNSPSQPAIAIMREKGHDIEAHLSRRISVTIAMNQDLILTMEEGQVQKIQEILGVRKDTPHIESLVSYASEGRERGDVIDPYGESTDVYRDVACRIEKLVDITIQRLEDEGSI